MTNDPPLLPSPEPEGTNSASREPETPTPAPEGERLAATPAPEEGGRQGGAGESEGKETRPPHSPEGTESGVPARRGGARRGALWAGALLIVALGVALGILRQELAAEEEAVGALRGEIAALKTERANPPAAPGQVAAEKLAALERRLAALEAAAASPSPASSSPAAPETASPGGVTADALTAALAARDARIIALEKETEALKAALATLEGRLALLEARDRLARDLAEGRPFGTAVPLPPPLARFATTPPPTLESLATSLDQAARTAAKARLGPAGGAAEEGSGAGKTGSGLRRLLAGAESLVTAALTIRHEGDVVWGDPVAAAVGAAQEALARGDLERAVTLVSGIQGPQAAAFQPWLGEARALLAARAALETLGEGA